MSQKKNELPQKKIRSMAEMRIEIENERGIPAAADDFSKHKDPNVPEDYICPDGINHAAEYARTYHHRVVL